MIVARPEAERDHLVRVRDPGLNARTAGVYLRADPSDLQVLDGGNEEERAQLIAQRLQEWKSAANAF